MKPDMMTPQGAVDLKTAPKRFKLPHRNRAFDKIAKAQANINRQLHGTGGANWRRVNYWLRVRNKWLAEFKRK